MKLSQERAQSVAAIFRLSGLQRDRLMLRGMGGEAPRAANDSVEGRALNRRVELLVTPQNTMVALLSKYNMPAPAPVRMVATPGDVKPVAKPVTPAPSAKRKAAAPVAKKSAGQESRQGSSQEEAHRLKPQRASEKDRTGQSYCRRDQSRCRYHKEVIR